MKLFLTTIFLLSFSFCISQTTIMFKPSAECGKDASLVNSPTWNTGVTPISTPNPNSQWLRVEAWTAFANGSPEHDHRSIIEFEALKNIINIDLISATLKLYAYPDFPFANGGQAEENDVEIFRVTEPWLEDEVSWATLPSWDQSQVVEIPQNNNYDFIEVDVTDLVQAMIDDPDNSYGFLLKQKDEDPYGSMDFASSDYPDYDRAPELIIEGNDIEFAESPQDIFASPDTTLCIDQGGLILNVENSLAVSYQWSDGSNGSAIGITTPGEYWVTIDYTNCLSLTDTIQVFIEDYVFSQTAFATPDTVGCLGQPILLDVSNSEAFSYEWSDNSTGSSLEINQSGTYSVNILLENCTGITGSIEVDFVDCAMECEVKIPNVFTPNGDGVNDFILPVIENNDCFEIYDFKIFNRWGQKVFSSVDPSDGWDGKIKSKPAPSDVYTYFIQYKLLDQKEISSNGDITLSR